MEYKDAVGVIESCAGFSDIETPVGEAWDIVLRRVARLEEALKELLDYSRACEGLLNAAESGVCVKARRALEEK